MQTRHMSQWLARGTSLVLVVAGIVWLLINKAVGEGPTLLVLGGGHGVTASDLLSLVAFAGAALLWRRGPLSTEHR